MHLHFNTKPRVAEIVNSEEKKLIIMKTFIRLCNQVKNCEWKINDRSKCFGRRQGYFVWELELSFCLCKTNFTAACLVLLFICEHVSFVCVCVCLFIYFLSIQRGERENLVDF